MEMEGVLVAGATVYLTGRFMKLWSVTARIKLKHFSTDI